MPDTDLEHACGHRQICSQLVCSFHPHAETQQEPSEDPKIQPTQRDQIQIISLPVGSLWRWMDTKQIPQIVKGFNLLHPSEYVDRNLVAYRGRFKLQELRML